MSNTAANAGRWLQANPGQTAWLIASTLSLIVPGIVSGPLLWILGFGGKGPIFGWLAASIQSTIGVVRAKSWFAILTSAGMRGYGTVAVNALVRGVVALFAVVFGALKVWSGRG